MSHVFARRDEPTPVITALEMPGYFDALREADRGDLRTFVRMLERKAIEGLESAAYSIRKMLEGRHEYFHMNSDLSANSPGNGWTRHRGMHGRESVIDIDAGGGAARGSVGKNGEKGIPRRSAPVSGSIKPTKSGSTRAVSDTREPVWR